jgi:ribonuclease HI
MSNIDVFTDGGARGNPGPAAAAFIIKSGKNVFATGGKYLGVTTNNIAEYRALIMALEWLAENNEKFKDASINIFLDSLLVVSQLKGLYKIKNKKLIKEHDKVIKLLDRLKNRVNFSHITRDKNAEVDRLVNVIFDEKLR